MRSSLRLGVLSGPIEQMRYPNPEHKEYKMRWKDVEMTYTPTLNVKPHNGQRWYGLVKRSERKKRG